VTLENALFFGRVNDIAFILDKKFIILAEHQSTDPKNLAVRLLLYIAREYEKLLEPESIYRTTEVKIPAPEFLILYNGESEYPDEKILRLSDAFIDKSKQNLELTAKVININKGRNDEILQKSENLNGYAVLVDRARSNQKSGMSLKDALTEAVNYCINNNIIKKFLQQNASEVENMLFTEFDINVAKKVWKNDGLRETAQEMFLENESIERIRKYSKLPDKDLNEVLITLPKEIQDKYKFLIN
jgi:hypothetical protein